MNIWKRKGLGLFVGGVLFGTAGIKILSSRDARKVYTSCTAAVLRAKDCVMKTVTAVQENAEDILAEQSRSTKTGKRRRQPARRGMTAKFLQNRTKENAERSGAAGPEKGSAFAWEEKREICDQTRMPGRIRIHMEPEAYDLRPSGFFGILSDVVARRDESKGL